VQTIPLLLSFLTGFLLAFLIWALLQARSRDGSNGRSGWREDVIIVVLLICAAFAVGIFLTYTLLAMRV
jgi:hypothetical protein